MVPVGFDCLSSSLGNQLVKHFVENISDVLNKLFYPFSRGLELEPSNKSGHPSVIKLERSIAGGFANSRVHGELH